jgi:hypothetical protein
MVSLDLDSAGEGAGHVCSMLGRGGPRGSERAGGADDGQVDGCEELGGEHRKA